MSPHRITIAAAATAGIVVLLFAARATVSGAPRPPVAGDPVCPRKPDTAVGTSAPPTTSRVPAFADLPEGDLVRTLRRATDGERADFVVGCLSDPRLPEEGTSVLLAILQDRAADPTLRNNAANALMLQEQRPTAFEPALLRMVADPDETPIWREYALQHLASVALTARDPRPALDALAQALDGEDGALASTAALQLQRLDLAGIAATAGFDQRVLGLLRHPQPGVRVTALGLAAERRLASTLAEVRPLTNDPSPAVRRAAIAAWARLGGDVERVRSATADSDPGVAQAAHAALARASTVRTP